MATNKKNSQNGMSENLKLRHYIMGLIYRNGNESVMIPSSRSLSAEFGVARSTVQLAIDQLVKENYLYTRQGIGTFTNPVMAFHPPEATPQPLIGIIWGDGRAFFYTHHQLSQLSSIELELSKLKYNIHPISLYSDTPSAIMEEIQLSNLDGLVWIIPQREYSEVIETIADEIPTIVIPQQEFEREYSGVNNIIFDYRQAGNDLGERLLCEQRTRLLFAVTGIKSMRYFSGIREFYSQNAQDYKETVLSDKPMTFSQELNLALKDGPTPDVLFINGKDSEVALRILRDNSIDIVNQCRVVCSETYFREDDQFCGLMFEEPADSLGKNTAEIMKMLLNKESSAREQRKLPVTIRAINI